jgi:hypothetical protein
MLTALEEAVRFRHVDHDAMCPLELPEDEFLILLGDAIAADVFSARFVDDLSVTLF